MPTVSHTDTFSRHQTWYELDMRSNKSRAQREFWVTGTAAAPFQGPLVASFISAGLGQSGMGLPLNRVQAIMYAPNLHRVLLTYGLNTRGRAPTAQPDQSAAVREATRYVRWYEQPDEKGVFTEKVTDFTSSARLITPKATQKSPIPRHWMRPVTVARIFVRTFVADNPLFIANIRDRLGTTNKATVDSVLANVKFPAGTLLFAGIDVDYYEGPQGQRGYEVEYEIQYRRGKWLTQVIKFEEARAGSAAKDEWKVATVPSHTVGPWPELIKHT